MLINKSQVERLEDIKIKGELSGMVVQDGGLEYVISLLSGALDGKRRAPFCERWIVAS